MKTIYCILGFISLALGIAGIVLPLLPTTPFLLSAAWFFSKGSEKWNNWLLNHKTFGPHIKNFKDTRSIHENNRRVAYLTIVISTLISVITFQFLWLQILLVIIGIGLVYFISTFDSFT